MALKEEKVPVTSGKKKGQCSKGDRCSFRHESDDHAKKPEHTAATPSEPSFSRGRSVSKKRSLEGKRNHGAILRQPCRYCLKGTCTRECQFHKTETVWPRGWGLQGMPRRTREGPETACVQTPLTFGWHTQGGEGRINACGGTVLSALPARVRGRHVVRG